MKNIDLEFKNFFNINKKNISNKYFKNFNKVFEQLKKDFKDDKKTINVLDKKYDSKFKLQSLNKFKKFKKIAIIGMGGSILGTQAIHNFLYKKINKKVYFFDNIDEEQLLRFKKKNKISSTLFIIISKSGNTIETLSNLFSLNILKKNSKNIIIISEKKDNSLYNLSNKLNLFFIEHNENIGGRYSVLSETGIIPSFLMGIDIKKIRSKLTDFFIKERLFLKESSIYLSNILMSNKLNNLIFLNYAPELEKFLFWCQQLIAESLGKKKIGFLPLISNVPKDHHSLLQLYLDGPRDKIFYIFSSKSKSKIKISFSDQLKENDYLNKKLIGSIKNAQKEALIKILKKKKIPFREFKIKKNNEETIGKLFSYFIIETILLAKLSNIDPFNQPAVEQVKLETKNYLAK